jgi:tartrate-resistant acid phosphatase type 5
MKKGKFRIILIYLSFALSVFSQTSTTSTSLAFITFGDWGREGEYGQKETADEMGAYAEKNKIDFVMTLGDNFYPAGVTSVKDKQWKTSFENVYTDESLQVPWYITLGNHDYLGNIQAQIQYTYQSKRWICPNRYYSFERQVDDSTSALFIILDTYSLTDENILSSIQLMWLDSILARSKAKWKIAAGHHPVYSGGVHGNTTMMIEDVKPIFQKYHLNIYLAGHDHDMQYLKDPTDSTYYFVSGGGSQLRDVSTTEYTRFARSTNGFVYIKMSKSQIKVRLIDSKGKRLYTVNIK